MTQDTTPTSEKKRLAAVKKVKLMGTPAEERFDRITRLARHLFDVPMAAIDIAGEELAWFKSAQGFDGIEGLRKDSYCHHTVLHDGVLLINDARKDPRVCQSAFINTWVFYAGVPLYFEEERVGVLCIGDTKPREFQSHQLDPLFDLAALAESELEIAALSASQLALALSNRELEKKANIDTLTHTWNRAAILDITQKELINADNHSSIAVLMIDIDNYKQINDTHGHRAGDQVLRIIAERLRMAVRSMDAIGRYGGDEFIVVMTNIQVEDAKKVSQQICEEISMIPVFFEDKALQITCSVGCTIAQSTDSLNVLLTRADQALYQAKHAGKNCVVLG